LDSLLVLSDDGAGSVLLHYIGLVEHVKLLRGISSSVQ